LAWLNNIGRPQQSKRIPSVLTKDKVAGLLAQMDGINALLARLLYGTGMRLMEGMRLPVKDVDFERHAVIVREAKGNKDRVVMLPCSLASALRLQMLLARALWEADRQAQRGGVEVPHALDIKYPKVGSTLGLALDVSFAKAVNRPAHWRYAQAPIVLRAFAARP
jgi:integrase